MHTLAFAVVLGAVCAGLLVGTDRITRERREANERGEKVRNVLTALEVPVDEEAAAEALFAVFKTNVRHRVQGGIEWYEYVPEGTGAVAAVAMPFSGAGVWGPIHGILALDPEWVRIRGVRFYRQEETPGLGGEIASDAFQDQFVGKRIVSDAGVPGIRIVKRGVGKDDENSVDAISGATMTSERVESILNGVIRTLPSRW
jgi:Na+-transporting NADH:ubiquinone oxidoreductase subunit C